MAKKKKTKRNTKPIVSGYLEKVNAKIFDKFRTEITEMTKGHQGIYALYRRNKLYYVGLASNLRNRIKYHLRDRHQGKWTHFSLYIIGKSDHIKELESLLLRIAYPEGNSQRGKLRTTNNLLPKLKNQVKKKIKDEYEDLFKTHRTKSKKKVSKKKQTVKGEKPLKGLFKKRTSVYAIHKGYEYKALVYSTGTIRYDGTLYDTPSAAGAAAREGKSTNGWVFWKYKDKDGNLVKLAELRK